MSITNTKCTKSFLKIQNSQYIKKKYKNYKSSILQKKNLQKLKIPKSKKKYKIS